MSKLLAQVTCEQAGLRVAPAEASDFEAVARLFGELHELNAGLDDRFALGDGWRSVLEEHFRRTHARPNAFWGLARDGETPVGLVVVEARWDHELYRHRSWAELMALYVSVPYRGTGLAARLLAQARSWSVSRGFDRLQLYVTTGNERARRFYSRCDMKPVQEVWRDTLHPSAVEGTRT